MTSARMAEFHPDRPHEAKGLCRPCYHVKNDAKRKQSAHEWRERNRKRESERSSTWLRDRREKAITALGSVCKFCGHTDRRVLEIDHINERNMETQSVYLGRILNGDHNDLQLLCSNCHTLKTKGYI